MPSDTADANGTAGAAEQPKALGIGISHDRAINFAFQQNAIPVIKELRFQNDAEARRDLVIRISTEPDFAVPSEVRLQAIDVEREFVLTQVDLKLSPSYFASAVEKVAGLLKVDVVHGEATICSIRTDITLLARNEWCGLSSLPEILAAFVLPNDPAVMTVLGRAAEVLSENTGRSGFNGYQDKNRKRAWEEVAAIYRAILELKIRYIVPPASFESTGQKVRLPSDILEQRFATCLDLALLFAACCEQAGLHPLVLVHDGHAYAGCWLEPRTMPLPAGDDLQYVRKLVTDELVTVFESTLVTEETPSRLTDSEARGKAHLNTTLPFRLALDVRASRVARIHPLPIAGDAEIIAGTEPVTAVRLDGLGEREFSEPVDAVSFTAMTPDSRVAQWKSRLLDLTLRNRLLNFKETKTTIQLLSNAPDQIEDQLAAAAELKLLSKPRLMSERDPRDADTYAKQKRADALDLHLREELDNGRIHTLLEDPEHARRLTELFRSARSSLDENGTNTLFVAVGILEWRETEKSDRVFRAPLLLVPVELKRKSVIEGFSLRRIDEDSRVNVTLLEMLHQHFQKDVRGLDPLPEDHSGVDVRRVLQIFRDAVRDMAGWEVKSEAWLGQFSFAKFLLWEDLHKNIDSILDNRVVEHLVKRAGTTYENRDEDIRPEHLDRRFHPRQVLCPRSADSSQLAAVMAAANGHDFVLEGPPGTGKSQTITNIIAHCLGTGKRVLFVAEKRAALDVVNRRLRESGLEPFCLELHSNKAGKADVLAQFEHALSYGRGGSTADWERRSADLDRARHALNEYVEVLHRRLPSGLSAYASLDYLLPRMTEPTVSFVNLPAILATPVDVLERMRDAARLIQERTRAFLPLAAQPLAAIGFESWTPTWAEQTASNLHALGSVSKLAVESTRDLMSWLGRPHGKVPRSQRRPLRALVEALLAPRPVGPAFATTTWKHLNFRLDVWAKLVRERLELRITLAGFHDPQPDGVFTVPSERWSTEDAATALAGTSELRQAAILAAGRLTALRAWLRAPQDLTRTQLTVLAGIAGVLHEMPFDAGSAIVEGNERAAIAELGHLSLLVRERSKLRKTLSLFEESKLLALDLDDIDRRWRSAEQSWFLPKWLGTRRATRDLLRSRRDPKQATVGGIGEVLTSALRLREIQAELRSANQRAMSLLGPTWQKGEPDPNEIDALRKWAGLLHERMRAAVAHDPNWEGGLRQRLGELIVEGRDGFARPAGADSVCLQYLDSFAGFEQHYASAVPAASLRSRLLELAPDHLGQISVACESLLQFVPRLRTVNLDLRNEEAQGTAVLGDIWNGGEPTLDGIEDARLWGSQLHVALRDVAGADSAWLLEMRELLAREFSDGNAGLDPTREVGKILVRYRDHENAFEASLRTVTEHTRLRRAVVDDAPDHAEAVGTLVSQLELDWTKIRPWCSWQRTRSEAGDLGLAPLISYVESPEGGALDVPDLFERSFRRSLLHAIVEVEQVLRDFFGTDQDDRIHKFRELDQQIGSLATSVITSKLAAQIPRETAKASATPNTEIGLLRKELGKRARHIPVRQLLGRIPSLLPRLKPCVLMSPLSVAQYLDTTQEKFDVVIFDEASQIPVWDAVGAIARGKQLIVVGDPKQLPPTNFFNTAEGEDDDDTPEEHKDLESILDELLSNGMRHKRLQWHYRSRHEGLITFSNQKYYGNELLTFPSPETDSRGVRFRHLAHARYDKGKSRTNRVEAEVLVAELVARLTSTEGPKRSYGVVTFSLAQQKLVENLLDEERRKHPDIERHFGDAPPVEGEPVFVKNLENVQGDERDVIMFSICYGPDETGRVSMNFGPLNRDGGERRLNVAITRAKHEVLVISGLRADQIDLTKTRATGVSHLKSFLEYAERGPSALLAATHASADSEPDSEFERMVADRIRAAGFDVHHQVGCSGYRVDLGVVDPKAPGRYLLGVECDGATYHRAATARDRDKLRQAILEELGWTLHRIWSTDWWHDANGETAKLLAAIRAVVDLERSHT
jgi:very-short-patch-repair endonuclease